jgi:hypothetical protein
MDGVVNRAGASRVFKFITFSRGAAWVMTRSRIWLLFVSGATRKLMEVLKTERAALTARYNSGNLVLCASSQLAELRG